jgi:hypothetical protein
MKRLMLLVAAMLSWGLPASAQRRDDQAYFPGAFNWTFLERYPEAARLFNAFDYGHAILYERLWTHPSGAGERLAKDFEFLTGDLLRRPPRFSIAEEAVMPSYARLVSRARGMFDWAHLRHRQIYDVYADERVPPGDKQALVERLTDYYLSNRALAFTVAPKSMSLMDDAFYSQVFRKAYPDFNGLIWAYHWLQVGLYEPLIGGESPEARKAGVGRTLARFWQMVDARPAAFPELMPMTGGVAPLFTARHPRAAVIFDNLHMMHDIISDILLSERVPRAIKGKTIEAALAEFRDGSKDVMSMKEWLEMPEMMGGVERMGGVAWIPPPTR